MEWRIEVLATLQLSAAQRLDQRIPLRCKLRRHRRGEELKGATSARAPLMFEGQRADIGLGETCAMLDDSLELAQFRKAEESAILRQLGVHTETTDHAFFVEAEVRHLVHVRRDPDIVRVDESRL